MFLLLLLCLVACTLQNSAFVHFGYSETLKLWRDRTLSDSNLKQHTFKSDWHVLPNSIDCDGGCQFPIFQYQHPNYTNNLPTVFLVAGFHGDQVLGVTILNHLYEYLDEPGHLVILPIANPSGYYHHTREEYPSRVDPNRDFPYATKQNICMVSGTARIIDYVYRTWKIDLTVTIHAGGNQIGWNWGTELKRNVVAQDDLISRNIAEAMKNHGGFNPRIGMPALLTGDMNTVVYSAQGSFEDWAYAASWDTEHLSRCHSRLGYPKYPEDMHQSLVFLFEAGPKQVPDQRMGKRECVSSTDVRQQMFCHGYVTRGIRVMKTLLAAAYPSITITRQAEELLVRVTGCGNANLQITAQSQTYKFGLVGSLFSNQTSHKLNIDQFKERDMFNNSRDVQHLSSLIIEFTYALSCDSEWNGLGRSAFGKGRYFTGSYNRPLSTIEVQDTSQSDGDQMSMLIFRIVVSASLVMLVLAIYFGYKCMQKWREFKPTQLAEEIVTTVGQMQQISVSIDTIP